MMTNEHSKNNFMDQNTTQPQANQGAAVLVGSGTLLASDLLDKIRDAKVQIGESIVIENLRKKGLI